MFLTSISGNKAVSPTFKNAWLSIFIFISVFISLIFFLVKFLFLLLHTKGRMGLFHNSSFTYLLSLNINKNWKDLSEWHNLAINKQLKNKQTWHSLRASSVLHFNITSWALLKTETLSPPRPPNIYWSLAIWQTLFYKF